MILLWVAIIIVGIMIMYWFFLCFQDLARMRTCACNTGCSCDDSQQMKPDLPNNDSQQMKPLTDDLPKKMLRMIRPKKHKH